MDALIQHPMVGDDIGCISRNEQPLEFRIEGEQVFDQVPAVHLGHDHIAHDQVYISCMLLLAMRNASPGELAVSTL